MVQHADMSVQDICNPESILSGKQLACKQVACACAAIPWGPLQAFYCMFIPGHVSLFLVTMSHDNLWQ